MKPNNKLFRIPKPIAGNWKKAFWSWAGFVEEIRKSTGKNLGSGMLLFATRELPNKSLKENESINF